MSSKYFFFSFFFFFRFLSFFAFFFFFLDSFSDSSESEEDSEELSDSLELLLELDEAFSFFFSSLRAENKSSRWIKLQQDEGLTPHGRFLCQNHCKQTFGFWNQFSTVHHFYFSVWSAVRVRFLALHCLNNLLARNHMTKNHMDTEEI